MGKYIRHQVLMFLAIGFICIAIFPFIFFYCISLSIRGVVGARTAEKMDRFWDTLGKPYDYLVKSAD